MGAIFRGLRRPRTYISALFLASRLPLGLLYFTVLSVGLIGGLTGALVLVGIPAIVLTFAVAWGFAAFERHLARWWLGVDIAPLSLPRPRARATIWQARSRGRASCTCCSSFRLGRSRYSSRCSASASRLRRP